MNSYQYWCGAQVVVEVESMPLLECCGIRMSIMESKRPIYGYSSRHFDAVANGQVLVEGALLINYVHQNYLFEAIRMGLEATGQVKSIKPPPVQNTSNELYNQLSNEIEAQKLVEEYAADPTANPEIAQAVKDKIWRPETVSTAVPARLPSPNPHDAYGGVDLRVTFGDKEVYNFGSGVSSYVIQDVHFLGRGHAISIDEQTIVEEYPFFARNVVHVPNPYMVSFTQEGAIGESNGETVAIARR